MRRREDDGLASGAIDLAVPGMIPRSLLAAMFVLVIVLLEALTPISSRAWAADLPFPSGTVLSASGGGGPQQVVKPSPAGCVGKSNNPHKDLQDTIKGLTQIECDIPVASLRTTAQLWRRRWWGYQMVGARGDNTNPIARQVKASGVHEACENNNWRTEGEHWSKEAEGTFYAHTVRHADVGNC